MLTKADIKWLSHLSNTKKVKIIPYNPKLKRIFEKQKKEILDVLGQDVEVLHRGASGMCISGQEEIDIAIPISLDRFDELIKKFKKVYGDPKSFVLNNRVRFNHKQGNINIEIVIVNQDSEGWKKNMVFEDYLKSHPEALEEYRKLKEANHEVGIKEYYRRKMEFINNIIDKALSDL